MAEGAFEQPFNVSGGDYSIWTLIDFTIDEYFYYDDASVDLSKRIKICLLTTIKKWKQNGLLIDVSPIEKYP